MSAANGKGRRQLAVIGAGPAGYAAAFMAADKGMKVTLIDPEPNPGGVCLYRGCIPAKALLHSVKAKEEAIRGAQWGISFGEPKIDLDSLRKWKSGVVKQLTRGVGSLAKRHKLEQIRGLARLTGQDSIEITPGVGSHHDSSEADDEGSNGEPFEIEAEQIIVATGAYPTLLPMMPDDERVWTSEEALDLPSIPKRLLVVGGGYIGLEMSFTYASLGSAVDIVEMTDGLMPGADRDLVEVFEKENRETFERILTSTRVDTMEAQKQGLKVGFTGEGAPQEPAVYDAVLACTGRKPNLEHVGLDEVGVELTDEGYVAVDSQMRTSVDGIFAVGDIAGAPMLAHKGLHEGRVAAEVAAGDEAAAMDTTVIPAVEYTDPEIAWCGLTETEAAETGREVAVSRFPWQASGRALTMGRHSGLTKLVIDPETERILGAGIAGTDAGELIPEAALAIEMAATVRDLELTIHPHPTLSETLLGAAERFYGTATDV